MHQTRLRRAFFVPEIRSQRQRTARAVGGLSPWLTARSGPPMHPGGSFTAPGGSFAINDFGQPNLIWLTKLSISLTKSPIWLTKLTIWLTKSDLVNQIFRCSRLERQRDKTAGAWDGGPWMSYREQNRRNGEPNLRNGEPKSTKRWT